MALYRAVMYTAALGGLGYVLMEIVTPKESEIAKELVEGQNQYRSEAQKKRQAIVDVLKGAAEGRDPMYRQSRAEIDAAKEKYIASKRES